MEPHPNGTKKGRVRQRRRGAKHHGHGPDGDGLSHGPEWFMTTGQPEHRALSKKGNRPPPIEFQVIRASDFVCFDVDEEHLNFEESKKVLEQLARACRKRGLDRAMVDLRDLPVSPRPRFTNAELADLAGAFRSAGFSRRQRLAVVYSHDVYGTVREFVSANRKLGLQVEAFLKFDDALVWLAKGTEHPVEQRRGAEVPIVRKRARPAKTKTKTKTKAKRKPRTVRGRHLAMGKWRRHRRPRRIRR